MTSPLSLDPRCEAQLYSKLVDKLHILQLEHGNLLNISALQLVECDATLPAHVRRAASTYVSELPFYTFARDMLYHSMAERLSYNREASVSPLTDFLDEQEIKTIAHSIIVDFKSLPWSFMLTFKAGPAITAAVREEQKIDLGDSIRIFYPSDDYHLRMPRTTGNRFQDDRLLGGPYLMMSDLVRRTPEWDSNECYIQLQISGYTGRYRPLQPAEEAYSVLRSLLGMSVALGFYGIEQRSRPIFSDRFQDDVFVHILRDGRADLWSSYELPDDLATTMSKLVWTGNAPASAWTQLVNVPFSSSSRYSRVLLASEWLFYSLSGHRQVTDFLHAIVALEILLGGKTNGVSMTQMLSNRCGYLIGNSRDEIDKIVADVKKIYGTRSAIVHGGKSKLLLDEIGELHSLQNICKRVLGKEIQLLMKDESSSKA